MGIELEHKENILDIAIARLGERKEAWLYPLELHIGAENFDLDAFLRVAQEIKENDDAFAVLVGDTFDFALRDSVGDPYAQDSPEKQMEQAIELLSPLAERRKVLAMIEGNHEQRIAHKTGIHPGKWVARTLRFPFLRNHQGILKLSLGKNSHGKPVTYVVHMAHGYGGSRTHSGKLAAALRSLDVVWNADVYIVGHHHIGLDTWGERFLFDPRNNSVMRRRFYLVIAGSFLGYGDYAQRAVMSPAGVGCPRIWFSGKEHKIAVWQQ